MTVEELKAAGFYEMCEGIPSSIGRWDSGFQRRIRDRHGTRYFIGCYLWRHSKLGPFDDAWEVEVQFVEGCNWLPSETCVRVTAWNGMSSWTPADVLAWASGVWERMKPAHYEGGNTMTNEQTDRDVVIAQQAEARASAELMAANVQLSGFIVRSCRRQLPPSPTDPCPWCQHASPYLTDADNPMIQVMCGKCCASGPLMANAPAAVEAWNRIGSNTDRPNAT